MGGGFAACLPFLTKNKDKIEKIVKLATEKPGEKKPAEAKPTVEATAPGAADTKPAADATAATPAAAGAKPAEPAAADAKKPEGAAAQAADIYNKHKKEIHSAVDMASKFLKKH